MFKPALPLALFAAANPVFKYDSRKIRWLQRQEAPERYGQRGLLLLYTVIIVGMLITQPWDFGGGRGGQFIRVAGLFNVNLFGSLSSLLYVAADAFFVLSSITLINSQMNTGNWDLLRLTTLDRQSIIDAKYSTAYLRAWQVMQLNRAVQTGLALYTLLRLAGYALGNQFMFGRGLLYWLMPVLALVFAWYIPLWRMRAMTAVSVALSGRLRHIAFAGLVGLGGVASLQMALNTLGALPRLILFPLAGLPTNRFVPANANVDVWLVFLLGNLMVYGGTFLVCWLVQRFALRYALHAAFQPD
jgi:hypothetical protein